MTCVKGKSLSMCAYLCPQDTQEFIRSFQSETPLNRVDYTAQDFSLQERVRAQVETCSYPLQTAEVLPSSLFPLPLVFMCASFYLLSAPCSPLQHP